MPIPAERICEVNWAQAGMRSYAGVSGYGGTGIPIRTTVHATILASTYGNGASDASAGIQAALNACPSGQVVLLGAGTFRIESKLTITSSITLRGSGAGVTILVNPNGSQRSTDFAVAAGNGVELIRVGLSDFPHFQNTGLKTLTADGVKGTSTITLDNVTGLTVGQYVLVSEDQFYPGAWQQRPDDNGSANAYENWATDRVSWSRDRAIGSPFTISNSDASTDAFTLGGADIPILGGSPAYMAAGHSGTLNPTSSNGYYRMLDKPSATTYRLQPSNWNGVPIDVTTGGSGGTLVVGRGGGYQEPGPESTIDPVGWLAWHSRGYGHCYDEIKKITAINTGTNQVTFDSPLTTTYRTSHTAQVATCDTAFLERAGVENLTMHRGARGALNFYAAAECWAYNVEVYEYAGIGIFASECRKIHIEGSTVRYGSWRVQGGAGYATGFYNGTTESLIENSIMVDANKSFGANMAGAGCVLAYNHVDDTANLTAGNSGWVEVGLSMGHMGGSHHILVEGCRGPNADSDKTHGTTYAPTWHRCHLTGQRAGYTDVANRRCFGLGFGTRGASLTGSVLGRPGQMTGWQFTPTSFSDPNVPAIYKFGYDDGAWNQAADPRITDATTYPASALYARDNYDYLNNSIPTAESGTTPDSLYLSAAPSWWVGNAGAWPWVTPTAATKTHNLPATYRYEQGQWNDLSLLGPSGGGGGGGGTPTLAASRQAHGTDDTPTLTHTATAGRFLLLWVTSSGTPTITGPSGWTAVPQLNIFANFRARLFYKIATGSDSYACGLGSSNSWTISVTEWTNMPSTPNLRVYAQQEQNSTTPTSGATGSASVANDLVYTGLADSYETAAITQPSGYTVIQPPPANVLHYGVSFQMMGAVSFKVATGATEEAQWTRDSGFSGVGVYVFEGGGAGGGGALAVVYRGMRRAFRRGLRRG